MGKKLAGLFKPKELTQEMIDTGEIEWEPWMAEEGPEKKGKTGGVSKYGFQTTGRLAPAVGTGIRPENMPEWAKEVLPKLRQSYGERIKSGVQEGTGRILSQEAPSGSALAQALRSKQQTKPLAQWQQEPQKRGESTDDYRIRVHGGGK